eukprot:TRINITY_DN24750_c0_g1_i7.p1 TRINITY_DN24750_c0_g1~~TRINITY_DN24750_c0_g1_i7.p1  ORF type:complete len:664 (+),score=106.22 TRINITY_DN24750_c0_g1_i7:82-2073(+)
MFLNHQFWNYCSLKQRKQFLTPLGLWFSTHRKVHRKMVGADIKSAADRARIKTQQSNQRKFTNGNNELLFNFFMELRALFFAKEEQNSKNMSFNLSKAAIQIKEETQKINTLNELGKVKFVGPVIVKFVKEALWDQSENENLSQAVKEDENKEDENKWVGQSTKLKDKGAKQRKKAVQQVSSKEAGNSVSKEYIPQYGSANYAFLVVMFQQLMEQGRQEFGKEELMRLAEDSGLATRSMYGDCNKNNRYDGWSCLRGMLQKDPPLIEIWSNPLKCQLTEAGLELAGRLYESVVQQGKITVTNNQPKSSKEGREINQLETQYRSKSKKRRRTNLEENQQADDSIELSQPQLNLEQQTFHNALQEVDNDGILAEQQPWKMKAMSEKAIVRLPPLEPNQLFSSVYSIVLIIDQREQFSQGRKNRIQCLEQHLQRLINQGIDAEIRTLPVGDALWIARNKFNGQEYVLDYIVERKNVDDLHSSIKDKRYETQKFALRRCGLPNCFYLVEGDPDLIDGSLAVKTASVSTEVLDGFTVLRTSDIASTFRTYANLTVAIQNLYNAINIGDVSQQDKEGLMSFEEFSENVSGNKKMTIKENWGLMLTAVPGVGEQAAEAIVALYPTPLQFYKAFRGQACELEIIKIIGAIKGGQKAIGDNVARCVYNAFLA